LSVGIVLFPEHGTGENGLIQLVDQALEIAKKGGERIQIGEEEYHVDKNSIKIVFQPIVEIFMNKEAGTVFAYEALGRDPTGKFNILDFFKRYQAIGQLNELKCLCFGWQLKKAMAAGVKRVFVNVDFNVLRKLGLYPKPSNLEVILEISETEALHHIESHLEIVKKWREEGYKFAIDDFGAGFISLPFIAQAIPEYIKIDRSTILQAVSSDRFRRFLRDLIRVLGSYAADGIIAEGIETKQELQIVQEIGIYMAQGFLLGRPKELQ